MKYPFSFRIYPGRNNHYIDEEDYYWDIIICKTKQDMIAKATELNFEKQKLGDFEAIVFPIEKEDCYDGLIIKQPFLGYCLFYRESITMRVLSHEATHMGVDYLRRIKPQGLPKIDGFKGDNESLAYAISECNTQLVERLLDHGIGRRIDTR